MITDPVLTPSARHKRQALFHSQEENMTETIETTPSVDNVNSDFEAQRAAFNRLDAELQRRGWEDNEGAYGEFTFDIANRKIKLDYNERYTGSHNSQHVF
jgi:hypothetical protein